MATAEKDDKPNIGDLRSWHAHQQVTVQVAQESASRLVNGFVAFAGVPVIITRQETFLVLSRLWWDLITKLHYVAQVRWRNK